MPLATKLPLAIGATYMAATGFSNGFPDTNNQFGSGQPYAAGIVNGPLTAYSDPSGSLPSPFKNDQGVFSVASTDPTVAMPIYGSSSVQLLDRPAGRHESADGHVLPVVAGLSQDPRRP